MNTIYDVTSPGQSIEYIIRKNISCGDGSFCGMFESAFIVEHWHVAISAGLGYRYATANKKKRIEIDQFLAKFQDCLYMDLGQLLSISVDQAEKMGYTSGSQAFAVILNALDEVLA